VPLFNLAAAMNPELVPVNFHNSVLLPFSFFSGHRIVNLIKFILCLRLSSFDVDVIETAKKCIIIVLIWVRQSYTVD
jgi:uncharacterized membrane protein